MATNKPIATCALPPTLLAWRSLRARSVASWLTLSNTRYLDEGEKLGREEATKILTSIATLDDLLDQHAPVFHFFQTKKAFLGADKMKKWSRESLDEYILIPSIQSIINRTDCTFVSHFWRTKENPDPNGVDLRFIQAELTREDDWSYIWIDYTCVAQAPRTPLETRYFLRSLETVSYIVRNCALMWYYPPFEPRLWVLYEIATYMLTCVSGFFATDDVKVFATHVREMLKDGVRSVLVKYDYRCIDARDKEFLTAGLELLVLMIKLKIEMLMIRTVLDSITWKVMGRGGVMAYLRIGGTLTIDLKKGSLKLGGEQYQFTPFPEIDMTRGLA